MSLPPVQLVTLTKQLTKNIFLNLLMHPKLQRSTMDAWAHFLTSFPGRSHLQYLIAYSTGMQIQRGKAWEIWSRVVTSGRQKVQVDTRGGGTRQ